MTKKTIRDYYKGAFQLGSCNPFQYLKELVTRNDEVPKDKRIEYVGDIEDLEKVVEKENTEVEKF